MIARRVAAESPAGRWSTRKALGFVVGFSALAWLILALALHVVFREAIAAV
jgi:hypothetical protein